MSLKEAVITINGTQLSEAQVMTVRVSLGSYLSRLESEGLGDDEHGRFMAAAYLARGGEVMALIEEGML